MVSARHKYQTLAQGIHGIIAYEYADSAARLAATGFIAADLYKLSIQLDDNSLWLLTSVSPVTWVNAQVDLSIPGQTAGDILYYDGTEWTVLHLGDDGYVLAANTALTRPNWVPPSGGTATANFYLAAGTQTANSGTVVFSNSNGISFGMSGSSRVTASYTVPSTAGLISNINISAGTTSNNLTAVTFSNSNGISFGLNSSTITASYTVPSTAGLISAVNFSAGTTSNNLSAITFSNSNGLSFGLNGSTITGSYTVPTQTNQTLGLYGVGNTTGESSSSTFDARTISFDGAGAASVGYSNSSVVISVPVQSNQTVGLFALGNTTQNSSTTLDARSLSFNGLGAATLGYSNGSIQVSVPTQTAQTQNVVVPSAGTQTATSGTVVFSNSNGISFGMSGSSRITASYTVPSIAGLISAINVSAGTTSNNLSALTFNDANNVSFGLNGSTITATATFAQSNQTVGLYALGNTTQNSSTTLDARSLSFDGLGIVTVGYSNGSIQLSATTAAQTNQTIGLYAVGNTTQNSSTTLDARTLSFNGLGAATVGYSNGSIQISVPNALTNINVSAGTTSNNLTAITFSNSNGISFGLNASTITASYTVPTQTNQTVGLYAIGNTTQNSSTTLDARTLSFNGLGIITAGYSNGSIQISATQSVQTQNVVVPSAGTQTATSGTAVFSNSNNITFGMSGSSRITASYNFNVSAGTTSNNLNAITFADSNGISFGIDGSTITASVSPVAVSGIGAIIAGTQTATSGSVIFSNSNNVTFGMSNSSVITASVTQSAGLFALGNTTQNSSTTLNINALSLNGLGIVTVGYSNGSIQLSATQSAQTAGLYAVGNTTGQSSSSTFDARTISFQGAGLASVGYSNGSVVISTPLNRKLSNLKWPNIAWQTNFSVSNASFSLQHFSPEIDIIATRANLLMNLSGNTNSTGALTISLGLYTMSGSTMSLASSDSRQITWTSGSDTSASSLYGGISGTRYRTVGLGSWSITAGDYMLGMWFRTTNDGSWNIFGAQGPTIVGAVDANETNAYLDGFSTSSFTTAMVGSVNVTDTNYVRTGVDALQQPGIIFLGTF